MNILCQINKSQVLSLCHHQTNKNITILSTKYRGKIRTCVKLGRPLQTVNEQLLINVYNYLREEVVHIHTPSQRVEYFYTLRHMLLYQECNYCPGSLLLVVPYQHLCMHQMIPISLSYYSSFFLCIIVYLCEERSKWKHPKTCR